MSNCRFCQEPILWDEPSPGRFVPLEPATRQRHACQEFAESRSKQRQLERELLRLTEENIDLRREEQGLRKQIEGLRGEVGYLESSLYEAKRKGGGGPDQGPHRLLHVQRDAPPEVIKAAYRAMAMKLHPDKGGSSEAMQKLNSAFESLKR